MEIRPELKFLVQEKARRDRCFHGVAASPRLVFRIRRHRRDEFNGRGGVRIFELIGLGQWFAAHGRSAGIELMMLTPWTRTAKAFLLACTMIGAIIVDIFVAHAVEFAFARRWSCSVSHCRDVVRGTGDDRHHS